MHRIGHVEASSDNIASEITPYLVCSHSMLVHVLFQEDFKVEFKKEMRTSLVQRALELHHTRVKTSSMGMW